VPVAHQRSNGAEARRVNQISARETSELVACRAGVRRRWHEDPARGRRLILRLHHRRKHWLVVLYPDSPGKVHMLGAGWSRPYADVD